jgi:hypothetical protein
VFQVSRLRTAPGLLFALGLALAIAGCQMPSDAGSSDPRPGNADLPDSDRDEETPPDETGDDGPDPVPARHTFSISASGDDPFVQTAPPDSAEYDLYLWLVCSETGAFFVEAELEAVGDALVEQPLSPDEPCVLITGTDFLALELGDCAAGPTRLGRIHLIGTGDGARVGLVSSPEAAGVVGCGGGDAGDTFSCLGFASDGTAPTVHRPEEGCWDEEGEGER